MGASVVAYALPTPLGANLARIELLAFPLMLVAALIAGLRPRWLVALALSAAFFYNALPYVQMASERVQSAYRDRSTWAPALAFLRAHADPQFRVESVPTAEHWEAYYLPAAGFGLARGWYRQLDLAQNPLLYRRTIPAPAYRAWLRSLGIRYVLLPTSGLDRLAAVQEADLLRSGRSGLQLVFSDPRWRIYELPRPTPILSGPAPARLTAFTHTRIAGRVDAPGRYRLRVRFMRYWQLTAGAVCVAAASDGTTVLRAARAGRFALRSEEQPGQLLASAGRGADATCRTDDRRRP